VAEVGTDPGCGWLQDGRGLLPLEARGVNSGDGYGLWSVVNSGSGTGYGRSVVGGCGGNRVTDGGRVTGEWRGGGNRSRGSGEVVR